MKSSPMTGFTEMMTAEKACCVVSVERCAVIGESVNGKVNEYKDGQNVLTLKKNI